MCFSLPTRIISIANVKSKLKIERAQSFLLMEVYNCAILILIERAQSLKKTAPHKIHGLVLQSY
jgi:hypothetical protein